jgi:MSHA pilin protein MshD|tara:strand:- start:23050 stop:23616 length:567 start_codon:yes stop_codon:yes gene_type:complete
MKEHAYLKASAPMLIKQKMSERTSFTKSKVKGFSLIELVITIVVIGIALTALSSSLFSGVGRNADPLWQSKATQLSQAYLDEILAMRYQEDSPLGGGLVGTCSISGEDAGESRLARNYDDVDDYHNLVENPSFLDTTAASNYSGYTVSIEVQCIGPTNAAANNSKLIAITITSPTNQNLVFSVFRADL